jgi:hypothetical protein
MPDNIYSLTIPAGIQRDGTLLSMRNWTDGQWCRFYRQLPKKMGGYSQMIANLDFIPRGNYVVNNSPNFNVYFGDRQSLKFFPVNFTGQVLGPIVDRTPALFAASDNNEWSFDTMYSTIDNSSILIAYAGPNLGAIDNNVEAPIYFGDSLANTPLVPTGISVSGGIVVLHPFLFMFGNSGDVMWSNANDPTTIMGSARITGRKIVAGYPTRGGNSSPAGLLWSLDSLIRVTQVGTTEIEFNFDTVASDSSILSSKGIVEYDGIYYWASVDRFHYYNGVVQELPNSSSLNYFFNNLNYSQRQKVWATKVTKWGEIWWFYPTGNNTECNKAVIFNVREQCWYDTNISRSCGYFEQTFDKPIWSGNTPDLSGKFNIWLHETGVDQNINGTLTAIDSYIETSDIAWVGTGPDTQNQNIDRWVDLYRVEPDFIQSGDMNLIVKGREYARSDSVDSAPYLFSSDTIKIDLREQRRQMNLRFESNVIGGDYYMGRVLMVARIGDKRT